MRNTSNPRHIQSGARSLVRALLMATLSVVLAAVMAIPALADQELDYDPVVNPVADNETHVSVGKFEKGTDHYLAGAKLSVYKADANGIPTDDAVVSWTSDGNAPKDIAGILDVNTEYVLVEESAPDGYEKAANTRFILRSEDFETAGEVLSPHDDVRWTEVSGTNQAFSISLYDAVSGEQHVSRTLEVDSELKTSDATSLAKTGDSTNLAIAAAIAVAGITVVVIGLRTRKKEKDQ